MIKAFVGDEMSRISSIPVYLSHSYRPEDREVNDHFWKILQTAGFSITVDPGTTSFFPTALEIMMKRSVGYVAIVTYREEEDDYLCSSFILHEYDLAVRSQQPRLVIRDKRVPFLRKFWGNGALEIEYDIADLGRSTRKLKQQLGQFRIQAAGRMVGHRYRREYVGIALSDEVGSGLLGSAGRRLIVEKFLNKKGWAPLDLVDIKDDYGQLLKAADACDFVIVDVDDDQMSRIATSLLGAGTPFLKVARRGVSEIDPLLLGSAPLLRVAAADQLVMYYADEEEFESRIKQQISRAMSHRNEFADYLTGHRYFRKLGRDAQHVFVSNAGAVNEMAKILADSLNLENIPFFHYRYHNTIGLGERWNLQLEQMVAASGIFLPLIDASYWASPYCRREYETAERLAKAGRIKIIPGLLDGFDKGPDIIYQAEDLRGESPQSQADRIVTKLDAVLSAKTKIDTTNSAEPLEVGRISVDVAIITILAEEYEAVLHLLKRVRPVSGSGDLDNQYSWVVGEVDTPTSPVPYTIALGIAPRAGGNAAVIVTKNAIPAVDPRCILVVGVAGGLGDVKLGDVVVAGRICAYEYGKIDHGFRSRPDMDSPTDSAIVSAANTLTKRYPGWYAELAQHPAARSLSPEIKVGNVASGDKVVDDTTDEFFAAVLGSRGKLLAVEMEGAGAAAAIQDAREMRQAVSFGMIRGISDLPRQGGSLPGIGASTSGQTEMRDSWKMSAALAAAVAAIQLIRLSWPRPPRASA